MLVQRVRQVQGRLRVRGQTRLRQGRQFRAWCVPTELGQYPVRLAKVKVRLIVSAILDQTKPRTPRPMMFQRRPMARRRMQTLPIQTSWHRCGQPILPGEGLLQKARAEGQQPAIRSHPSPVMPSCFRSRRFRFRSSLRLAFLDPRPSVASSTMKSEWEATVIFRRTLRMTLCPAARWT